METVDVIEEEIKLDTPFTLEVCNVNSEYFGEVFQFTHKVYTGRNLWYRAVVDYRISRKLSNIRVWFKSNELVSIEEC